MNNKTPKQQYKELANKILARRTFNTNTNTNVIDVLVTTDEELSIKDLRNKCDCAGVKYKKRDNKTILRSKLEF